MCFFNGHKYAVYHLIILLMKKYAPLNWEDFKIREHNVNSLTTDHTLQLKINSPIFSIEGCIYDPFMNFVFLLIFFTFSSEELISF